MKTKWVMWGCLVVVCILVSSAMAMASAELYGAAKFKTYYSNYSKEATAGGENSYGDTLWSLGAETHFGVNFKTGNISGQWEIGTIVDDNTGGSSRGSLVTREAWGQWDFGAGQLLIGHTFPLTDYVVATGLMFNQEAGLQNMGGTGYATETGRVSQIRLTFGDLAISLITPNTNVEVLDETRNSVLGSGVQAILPKLEMRYDWASQYGNFSAFGGIQTYEAWNDVAGSDGATKKNITSWLLGLAGELNYEAFTLRVGVNYRINGSNYGLFTDMSEYAYIEGDSIKDTWAIGVIASAGYRFTERFYMEAGGSYIHANTNLAKDTSCDGYSTYLTSKFTVAPGVYIHPEIVYYDYGEPKFMGVSEKSGNATHAGIYWTIEF